MSKNIYEVKADFDSKSIVMYQAFSKEIALAALKKGTFTAPFSFKRMTWIKPSYLWLMERSNWGHKKNQEHILAIHIHRKFWEKALDLGILTSPKKNQDYQKWNSLFSQAKVHIQWDPDRSIHGKPQENYAIQVGLSRHVIEEYVNKWIIDIKDYTSLTRKIYSYIQNGKLKVAKKFLPQEKIYPLDDKIINKLS